MKEIKNFVGKNDKNVMKMCKMALTVRRENAIINKEVLYETFRILIKFCKPIF